MLIVVIQTYWKEANSTEFRGVLDGKLKQLNRTGKCVEKKKAGVITAEMEEKLWESGMLGDHNPQVLLNTVLYLIRLKLPMSGRKMCVLPYLPCLPCLGTLRERLGLQ